MLKVMEFYIVRKIMKQMGKPVNPGNYFVKNVQVISKNYII